MFNVSVTGKIFIPCLILIEAVDVSGVVNLLPFHYVKYKMLPVISQVGTDGRRVEEGGGIEE